MADVRPFRAVRYARPTASVTAPPYDVIDEDGRRALAAQDPHNVVHLTLETDGEAAAERFGTWLEEGVLVREAAPAVWWLEQDFVDLAGATRVRSGIVASLRVEPYATGTVLPHERTHAKPIEGRLRLLRATRVELEQIFVLYEGAPSLERPERAPDVDVGSTRLWRLDVPVGLLFDTTQLLIADGHHRYETAVAFADEDGADRLPVVLVSTSDPGLEIRPTHRLFAGRPEIDPKGDPYASVADAMAALEREPRGRAAAVFVGRDGSRLVRGAEGVLDVDLVDELGHDGIAYTADREDAERAVASGAATCAFLVRAPLIDEVFARARKGRTMPPKTTFFFPKLVSGLLFQPVDP